MNVQELQERRDEVQLLDVRYPNEWDAGHIDGSRHAPVDEVADLSAELDRSQLVVTVCRSGERSAVAAQRLSKQGFRAQSLDGGLLAWAAAGLALTNSAKGPGTVAEPEPPDDDGEEQKFQADFIDLSLEVQAHFGDHDPSEEEIQAYLRDRMIRDGQSPEEADEAMARIVAAKTPGAG